jgi:peptide/nickel transport system substrate-binding protein
MLRGRVDMLYEVGGDAMDSLQSSNDVSLFTFERGYAYLALLNLQKPYLRDPAFRRALNAAVDRDALVADGLRGHGNPDDSAVWPKHWAYSNDLPRFRYEPRTATGGLARPRLKCLFGEPSLERLALVLQRQLQIAGIELVPELVPGDQVDSRLRAGDFDAFLSDFLVGPNLMRPYSYWHTDAQYNFGRYSNPGVDAGLDAIRHAATDAEYQSGVAAYERAIVDDPPAIFLAWRERAVAVSRRFVVPAEPDTDVFLTVRLWRRAESKGANSN